LVFEMGFAQELMAAARAYRQDPEKNHGPFVEAINASTNYDHRTLAQVSEMTGFNEEKTKTILQLRS